MIIMTLIVRNEGDIVAANVEHHLEQGVDKVIALDNGSSDETVEILQTYVKAGVLDLECVGDVPLDKLVWSNRQVRQALDEQAPTWIICNDADEFYSGIGQQTLKQMLDSHREHRILSCARTNWVGASDQLGREHWSRVLRYRSSLAESPPSKIYDPLIQLDYPFFYYTLPGKVVFQPHGFSGLACGAHSVSLDGDPEPFKSSIEIDHYPVRDLNEFIASVYRFSEYADKFPNSPTLSGKYRRWGEMLKNGVSKDRVISEVLPDSARLERDLESGLLQDGAGSFDLK